jgi:GT2 family glycosyltransferase
VAYLPVSTVMHFIGQTSSAFPFMPIFERHRSMYLYYKKHYSRELLFLDLATIAMVSTRCVLQLGAVWFKRLGRKSPSAAQAPAKGGRP